MTEEQFYELQPLAIFGVSSQGKGFGAAAYLELKQVGVQVFAINPKGGLVKGEKIYPTLKETPEQAKGAVILTKGDSAIAAVEECSREGIISVWLQGGSDSPEVRKLCDELDIDRMTGSCILMRKGRFPHNIHRFFNDLFNKPKQSGNSGTLLREGK
ncbi:CoA-binding protein [bacterium]|nr:CoA-binding protein [bacterium]MBU1652028.1 CoA-binding protein [bacterium]MBU1882607.1 CoA-binding protein [bacterium]